MLYHMATKIKQQIIHQLPLLVKYITSEKLDTTIRVDAALNYLLKNGLQGAAINTAEFEKHCGVGVVVTPEEIERYVEASLKRNKAALLEQRYRFNVFKLMQEVRDECPWADGKQVKNEIDVQIFDLLGEKTDADLAPPPKKQKEKKPAESASNKTEKVNGIEESSSAVVSGDGANSIAELMKKVHFHAPGENYKTDGYVVTPHTPNVC